MFENIGQKIKVLATAVFVIETIVSFIVSLVLMSVDEDLIVIGFLILVLGPLFAWLSAFLLYGFGELVDKTTKNESNTRTIVNLMQRHFLQKEHEKTSDVNAPDADRKAQNKSNNAMTNSSKHTTLCNNCKLPISQYPCSSCGYSPSKAEIPFWCGFCGAPGNYEGNCPSCGSSLKRYNNANK